MREENICLKVLTVEVQIVTSSEFPTALGNLFLLYRLANRVIVKANSQKGSRAYFHCNTIFPSLEKAIMVTLIKNNVI